MAREYRTLKLEILAETKQFVQDMKGGEKQVESFGDKATKMGKIAAAAFAAAAAAAAAYAVKLAVDGVKAAIEDEAAQARLAAALKNVTDATDVQIAALENQILKTSLATGVADDQLRPALQRLATATGDVKKSQELLNLALDISAATGKSVETVSNALGKAYEGNTGALSRLGIGLSTAEIKALGLEGTMAQLADTFGGAATVQANTLEGQISRLKILFQETQESVGQGLLPTVKNFLDYVTNRLIPKLIEAKEKSIDKVTAAFEDNREEMEALIAFGKKYLIPFFEQTLVKKIELVASVISNTIKVIGAVIRGIETIINKAIDAINVFIRAYNAIPDILKPGKGNIPLLNNVNFNKNDAESGQINTSTGSIFIPTPFVPPAPITPASPNAKSPTTPITPATPIGVLPILPSGLNPTGNAIPSGFDVAAVRRGDERVIINVNAPSAIDEEGFTRAVILALNQTQARTGGGGSQLVL